MAYILYESICNYKNYQYNLQVNIEQYDGGKDKQQRETSLNELVTNEASIDPVQIQIIAPSTKILFIPINQRSNSSTSSDIPSIIPLRQLINIHQIEKREKNGNGFFSSLPRFFEKNQLIRTQIKSESNSNSLNSSATNENEIPLNLSLSNVVNKDPEAFSHIYMRQTNELSESNEQSTTSLKRSILTTDEENVENNDEEQKSKTCVQLTYIDIKSPFQWLLKHLIIELQTEAEAKTFCVYLTKCLSILKERPRHLLVFVNPLCGKGKGHSIYENRIMTLFDEAQVNVDTIYTERANHARDYILDQELTKYDGIIGVGGDGMFSELCHGLLLKTVQNSNLDINDPRVNLIRPETRIGIIPAGSTDAVVYGTTGMNDPVTSALQIITGESLLIDLTTIHSEQGFVRFMATMLAYGFFGDIINTSERWRCLGPFRYDLAGFRQFVRNKSYRSHLSITLSPNDSSLHHSVELDTSQPLQETTKRQQFFQNTETDDSLKEIVTPRAQFCNRNCDKCSINDIETDGELRLPLQIEKQGQYTTINCLNMPCRCKKSKYGMSPFVHLGDGSFDLILVKRSWRTGFLRFLWQVANDSRYINQLPNVERYRVNEVLIKPELAHSEQAGNWSCDGELISGNKIQVRVHRQILNLFARGIEFQQVENTKKLKKPFFSSFWNKNKKQTNANV
ncbi:unnamed protein product [Didymodactylos carnosus]|uniref:DAGKc domain-containing protein n=2 Tax=Didymodactylos carnosus TaxID=1234261 RepID=A0A815C4D2_9BILA|nr:unnamed protein product [Didymodactylos carnosus]CAF4066562.1 unnamed protein product [Didymodactylos carnosus]